MEKIVMGIDAGTGGVRVGLFNLDGNQIAFGTTDYPTYHEHPGWAEQDPNDWWECLVKSTRKALKASGVKKEQIIGISLDTTCCSVVLSMDDGTPLRNSLIWMDVRAAKEAEFISNVDDDALKYNGHENVSPEWMPCKALWLKRNEPENYNKAEKVCEFADWYMYKLTGRWTANICNISTRWYYNRNDGGWPESFYGKIGLEDVLEKFPQDILNLGDNAGGLSKEAAEELGLLEGTIIGQGGVDAFIGMLGLGVIEPGKIALITGSSHLILGLTDKSIHSKGLFGSFPDAVIPGLELVEGGQTSTGSIISWFINNFCKDLVENSKDTGIDVHDYLTEEARKLPPGSEGLLVLDYWQGNRTPYTDPNIRGLMYGMSLNHNRAHIFRAIMEGIAFGTENVFQTFRENDMKVDEIYIGGGATNNDLFLQIHADVSNVVINIPSETQSPSLGSAILASVAAGEYDSIEKAVKGMIRFKKRIEPNKENHEKYQEIFEQYRKAYPEFGDWMKNTTKLS